MSWLHLTHRSSLSPPKQQEEEATSYASSSPSHFIKQWGGLGNCCLSVDFGKISTFSPSLFLILSRTDCILKSQNSGKISTKADRVKWLRAVTMPRTSCSTSLPCSLSSSQPSSVCGIPVLQSSLKFLLLWCSRSLATSENKAGKKEQKEKSLENKWTKRQEKRFKKKK